MRFHVEPFESYSELQGHWPGDGYILVHDADENIAHLAGDLPSAGVWLPIVAYDEALSQIVSSMPYSKAR